MKHDMQDQLLARRSAIKRIDAVMFGGLQDQGLCLCVDFCSGVVGPFDLVGKSMRLVTRSCLFDGLEDRVTGSMGTLKKQRI